MMSLYKLMRKGTWLIIVTTLIIVIVGISTYKKYKKQLHDDEQFNGLMLKIINSKNNENIFHTTNDEHDVAHDINVLDISGGAFKNLQYIVYLLRVNDHYLNENIDMLRMFNVFCGISSGAIITCAIAFRELVLKNSLKNNKSEFIQCMKMFKYSDVQIMKCIAHIENESTQLNYGTLILQWLFYLYLGLKTKLLNASVFKQITTLRGYLHPMMSSKDKHTYFKKYFDFDMKDIVKSRTFITCGLRIPTKISGLKTANKLILFTNYTKALNANPNIIKPEKVITNMADILNITTNLTGVYSANEQYPIAWDAGLAVNSTAMIIIALFTNYSTNLNLKYMGLTSNSDLIYANDEGLGWWVKYEAQAVHVRTKYDAEMIHRIQKNKAQTIIFKNETGSFDTSNAAKLTHIESGIIVPTNMLTAFINNEILK